ncbi:MAG: ABC transporter permease [Lentisphaeria bacterium]|nr:ABC transporter permease subunit [Lentisphaeria bacterium]NQZ70729.1 ABC transporter permease [Lentisphaeria bacterium]
MRPYIAILKDSFREAVASKLLIVVLIISTAPLLFMASFSLDSKPNNEIFEEDYRSWDDFLRKVEQDYKADGVNISKHLFSKFSPGFLELLTSYIEQEDAAEKLGMSEILRRSFKSEINKRFKDNDYYDKTVYKDVELSDKSKAILDQGLANISSEQKQHFHRRLLTDAYPYGFKDAEDDAMHLYFFSFDIWSDTSSKDDIAEMIVVWFVEYIVGVFAVFISIILTSWLIPRTFEAGAIDLLLSKPIHRGGLFIAKFLGGCSFILVVSIYLVTGTWIICGIRLGFWIPQILMSIPILLFLFMIYYSISALAGVIWRSTIVSIVITILFWALCFGMEIINGTCSGSLKQNTTHYIIEAEKSIIATTLDDKVVQLKGDEWRILLQGYALSVKDVSMITGPYYDTVNKRLILSYAGSLYSAESKNSWQFDLIAHMPMGGSGLIVSDKGDIICSSMMGLMKLRKKVLQIKNEDDIFERQNAFWEPSSDRSLMIRQVGSMIMNSDGEILAATGRDLILARLNEEGKYALKKKVAFEHNAKIIQLSDKYIITSNTGSIYIFDAELNVIEEKELEGKIFPRTLGLSFKKDMAYVLFENDSYWIYDGKNFTKPDFLQGEVNSILLGENNNYFVYDSTKTIRTDKAYKNSDNVSARLPAALNIMFFAFNIKTKFTGWEGTYRMLIKPIYFVLPKPGELSTTITHIMSFVKPESKEEEAAKNTARLRVNIWQPVWTSAIFMIFTLSLGCLYVNRKDY